MTSSQVVYAAACATESLCVVVVGGGGTAHRWDGTRWIDEGVVARG